jgi:NADH-quinone oxidoreductase subunit E
MAQLDKTFPTNDCAMCTLAPRLVDCGRHPNIEKLAYSEVVALEGRPGSFRARVKKKPRSVDLTRCTGCGECSAACLVRNRPYFEPAEPEPLELEAAEREELDRILGQCGTEQSSLLPILQEINATHRWLPPAAVSRVSDALGLPLARVLRVASFYNMFSFEPRGRHVITLCDGTACHVRGASRLLDAVREELAIGPSQTTPDRLFTLEVVNCLGACALAPVVVLDEQYHEKMTPDAVRRLLDEERAQAAKETAAAQ